MARPAQKAKPEGPKRNEWSVIPMMRSPLSNGVMPIVSDSLRRVAFFPVDARRFGRLAAAVVSIGAMRPCHGEGEAVVVEQLWRADVAHNVRLVAGARVTLCNDLESRLTEEQARHHA